MSDTHSPRRTIFQDELVSTLFSNLASTITNLCHSKHWGLNKSKSMLLSLMSPQLLEAAVPLSTIVVATEPGAVALDSKVDRFHMALEVSGTSEGLAAHGPGAWCALKYLVAELKTRGIVEVVRKNWKRLHVALFEVAHHAAKAASPVNPVLSRDNWIADEGSRGLGVELVERRAIDWKGVPR
jgi:hypothetical protein